MVAGALRLDSRVDWFAGNATIDDIGKKMREPVWREFIGGRLDFVDRPPPMLAHKDALQIVPAADVDIEPFDADEIEPLALQHDFARLRHRKLVFSHPDQRTDLSGYEGAFFG